MSELRVIIGAGDQTWDGWVATHRDQLDLLRRDTWESWFGRRRADALLCEHVFEHLSEQEARSAAKIRFDFLTPGAYCGSPFLTDISRTKTTR